MKKSISDFINTDYKSYSKYVLYNRAIPNIIDGMKPVHRKIFYTGLKNVKSTFMKTAALVGFTMAQCLIGNTKIILEDNSSITLEEFYKNPTKNIKIKCVDLKNNKIVTSVAINPRITKYVKQLIKITINKNIIYCTPEHPFLIKINENKYVWKMAKKLTIEDKIVTILNENE
jgi:hypothetical protein